MDDSRNCANRSIKLDARHFTLPFSTLSDFSQETVRLSKDKGSHRHDFQSSISPGLKIFRRTKTLVKSAVSTGSAD